MIIDAKTKLNNGVSYSSAHQVNSMFDTDIRKANNTFHPDPYMTRSISPGNSSIGNCPESPNPKFSPKSPKEMFVDTLMEYSQCELKDHNIQRENPSIMSFH